MNLPVPSSPVLLSRRLWRVICLVLLGHAIAFAVLTQHLHTSITPRVEVAHQIVAQFIPVAAPVITGAPVERAPRQPTQTATPSSSLPSPIAAQRTEAVAGDLSAPSDMTQRAVSMPTAGPEKAPVAFTPPQADTVVLPSNDADYLQNPPPAYPRMSRRLGEQGTVVLNVLINTEGRAEKAELQTSSGYPRLDEAALAAIVRWRFVPGRRNGVAQAMWFKVPLRFVLD